VKKCSKCGVEKKYAEFNRDKRLDDGRRSICKACEKRYRAINKVQRSQYKKKYRAENRAKGSAYFKKYRAENRAKTARHHNIRKARAQGVASDFTEAQWAACKEYFNDSCAYCGEKTTLQQEHLIALSSGGGYTKSNIVPACTACNDSKSNKGWRHWLRRQAFYSYEREQRIDRYKASMQV